MVRTYTRKYTNTRNGNSFLPYQNYSLEQLQEAINNVKEGRMSLTDAANTYGIPKSTLSRKTRNINCTQEKAGHPTLFSSEEERIFIKFILLIGKWGFPFDSTDLRVFAQKYLNKIGKKVYGLKDNMPGVDWARNFLIRHSSLLSNRKSANISRDRATITSEDIDAFFENYTKTIEGVTAECIINYDETNLTDDPGNKNYIYRRGCKYPERVINTSKTAISLMFSGTASGYLLPLYVVYKSEHLYDTWMESGPEGTRYNRSKSGWFDSVCFEDWFNTIIVPYVKNMSGRKVLIGDNLSSHFSEGVLRSCEELNIAFVCLPPKTTHLLQPLDVAFFAPLKAYWRNVLTKWKLTEGRKHKTLVKSAFPELLCELKNKLVEKDAESNNLKAGFSKSGLYPIDPNRPKSRLPQSQISLSEAEIESNASSVITHILMDIRCPVAPVETRRKKRFLVEPGKSVTADDIVKCQSKSNARSKQSKNHNRSSKSTSRTVPDPLVDPIPGPSGICNINSVQSFDSDMSDEQIAPVATPVLGPIKPYKGKGKGIGKKTRPEALTKEKQNENSTEMPLDETRRDVSRTTKVLKRKRLRKSKDSSTSVSDSDIMSTHSDSDIYICASDATVEADEIYFYSNLISKTPDKTTPDKTTPDKTSPDKTTPDKTTPNKTTPDKTTPDKTDLSYATEETDLSRNVKNIVISEFTNTTEDYKCNDKNEVFPSQEPSYSIDDFVLVRYLIKNTWTYYVGVITEINSNNNGQHKYNVIFFKTVKKPVLSFRKTRLIDRDIIDDLSIVKQIFLRVAPNNPNALLLEEEGDMTYFN